MESESQTLEAKKKELIKIKEEVKKAKEKAIQSWLDSRPLIDELEKLKSSLAYSQAKNAESETLVSELEAELEAVESSIKSKKDKEAIHELTKRLDRLHEETEALKRHSEAIRRKRSRIKVGLRVKRQKLQASQLMLVAAKKESEAHAASANKAMKWSSFSETESVKLGHQEYEALKKRAGEKSALADWLVSAAAEEKAAAEKSRDLAMAKWKALKKKKGMKMKRGVRREENNRDVVEEEEFGIENKLELVEIVDEKPRVIKTDVQPSNNKEKYYNQGPELKRRARPKQQQKKKKKNKKKNKNKKSFSMQMRLCFVFTILKRLFR